MRKNNHLRKKSRNLCPHLKAEMITDHIINRILVTKDMANSKATNQNFKNLINIQNIGPKKGKERFKKKIMVQL